MSEEKLVKVRLLSDGGYGGADNVSFPVGVIAYKCATGFHVSGSELSRAGFKYSVVGAVDRLFFFASEVEIVANEKQPKHRPSVSDENYDSVMTFEGKSFNEKLHLILNEKEKSAAELALANLRNNELEAKLGTAKSEASYSDSRLQAASKEITQLKGENSELKRKNNAADEHIIELNKELCIARESLCVEEAIVSEMPIKISKMHKEHLDDILSLKNRLSTESARAARYKFTTAIYGLCAIGFLIGWIYG